MPLTDAQVEAFVRDGYVKVPGAVRSRWRGAARTSSGGPPGTTGTTPGPGRTRWSGSTAAPPCGAAGDGP